MEDAIPRRERCGQCGEKLWIECMSMLYQSYCEKLDDYFCSLDCHQRRHLEKSHVSQDLEARIKAALAIERQSGEVLRNCPKCSSTRFGRPPDDESGYVRCGNCHHHYQRFNCTMTPEEYEDAVHAALEGRNDDCI